MPPPKLGDADVLVAFESVTVNRTVVIDRARVSDGACRRDS